MSSVITPPTVTTEEGFAVELAGDTAVVHRTHTPDHVWIEQQGGEYYVLVPRTDLVSVAAALLAAHVRLARESRTSRK